MLTALKTLFADLLSRDRAAVFDADDPRLAVAALMCHVVAVDGVVSAAERTAMLAELVHRYGLDDDVAHDLAEAARKLELEGAALGRFTAGLERKLTIEERRDVLAGLWRIAFSDGHVQEFEDAVVWRIADLLGVPAAEAMSVRKTVEASVEDDDDEAS